MPIRKRRDAMPPLKPDFIPITDEEDALVNAAIEADPDDWIPTDEELASARPLAEVDPEFAAYIRRHGITFATEVLAKFDGPREEVTVNLDPGLVTFFKQLRDGGEDLLNDMLRSVVFDEPFEITRCQKGVIYCSCDNDPVSEPEVAESAVVAT